jgi:DNA-binding NtrC family response regulator
MKILLVDDVREYLDSLARVLGQQHQVVTAVNLDEAKQKVDTNVNLALVDIRLSELDPANRDGILLLSWLKEKYPSLPVVMMSAYRDFDAAADALNLGAARYLKKPINLRELKETIDSLAR